MLQNNRLIYLFIIKTYFFSRMLSLCFHAWTMLLIRGRNYVIVLKCQSLKIVITENNPYNSLQCKTWVKIYFGERGDAKGLGDGVGWWDWNRGTEIRQFLIPVIQTLKAWAYGILFMQQMLEEYNIVSLMVIDVARRSWINNLTMKKRVSKCVYWVDVIFSDFGYDLSC